MENELERFAVFLNEKLLEYAADYDTPLLSVAYSDLGEARKGAAIRFTYLKIAELLPSLVKDFYINRGN
jgi:hypothetical protein